MQARFSLIYSVAALLVAGCIPANHISIKNHSKGTTMTCSRMGIQQTSPGGGFTHPKDAILRQFVGKVVTIRAIQTRAKQPKVCGISIDGAYQLSDKMVQATGVLKRREFTVKTVVRDIATAYGMPGTYVTYLLVKTSGRGLAKTSLAP